MLPEQIQITNDDIKYAEKILLPRGEVFDVERRDFIKNLDTIDLQAVPGSGKTTALLAKLLIIERYMPFDDGSGILVISHTNSAVDEIKNKIGKYCPRVFSYPNFIGTIQSFVDQFLAIPCYLNLYKHKLSYIDSDIYKEKSEKYFDSMPNCNAKNYLKRKSDPKKLFFYLRFDLDMNIVEGINGKIFLSSTNSSTTYKQIKKAKCQLFEWGYLHYDDAYFFANYYLKKFPAIKKILQKRFRFVFVDEMQDMDKHQYEILEKIFYLKDIKKHCFQRIGDKNQAIYYNEVKLNNVWDEFGRKLLKIRGSYRLTPEVANVIKYFGLEFSDILGLRKSYEIKPHIILYDKPEEVLCKYTKLIKDNDLTDEEYPFCAVCWTSHSGFGDEKGKIRLQDYHPSFSKYLSRNKIDYSCAHDYLNLYQDSKCFLKPIKENILNLFLKILRNEEIKDTKNRYFTKISFLNFIREKDSVRYEELKLKLFKWSWSLVNSEDAYDNIVEYLINFLKVIFGLDAISKETENFIEIIPTEAIEVDKKIGVQKAVVNNIHNSNGINVQVGTVHSAKGQTHTATLYMESFYQRGENYESKRLLSQLLEKKVLESDIYIKATDFQKNLIKQSAKVVYVGFSRPTHLLCFAINKKNLDTNLNLENWEII